MPAQPPSRPSPGAAMLLPRVSDDDTQRALQHVGPAVQNALAVGVAATAIGAATKVGLSALEARVTTVESELSGRILSAPIRLTGIGSGVLPAGTCVIHLEGVGQGGGGGGANGNGSNAAGGGGTSGVKLDTWIGTPGVPLSTLAYSWVSGSGLGAGGSAAGGAGAAGADTTFTAAGSTLTMKGGAGGAGMVGAANGNANPGVPAGGTSGAPSEAYYGPGGIGLSIGGVMWFSGAGGTTTMGNGGESAGNSTAGNPGQGAGGGGGGAAATGAATRIGGVGAAGELRITPYS